MFPKEKINKLYKNPNTRAFYKEYENKCRPNKLLNISKRGIELYEPLNSYKISHSNLIDISLITKQLFVITNLNQYRAFIKNIKDSNENRKKNLDLLIYNWFITKYTINNTDIIKNHIINDVISPFWSIIFYKAMTYNYINNDLFVFFKLLLFYNKMLIDLCTIYDYFYFNRKILFLTDSKKYYNSFLHITHDKNATYIINKYFNITL